MFDIGGFFEKLSDSAINFIDKLLETGYGKIIIGVICLFILYLVFK